jgi:hypothetical protein
MNSYVRIASVAAGVLLALAGGMMQSPSPAAFGTTGAKEEPIAARPLKFAPKGATVPPTLGGQNKLTVLADVAAVEKLLGKQVAKPLLDLVDLDKEQVVLVSWSTGGPPDGTLQYEVQGQGKERRLRFYVQGPAGAQARGQRLRLGADFFAVPRGVAVTFDPKER